MNRNRIITLALILVLVLIGVTNSSTANQNPVSTNSSYRSVSPESGWEWLQIGHFEGLNIYDVTSPIVGHDGAMVFFLATSQEGDTTHAILKLRVHTDGSFDGPSPIGIFIDDLGSFEAMSVSPVYQRMTLRGDLAFLVIEKALHSEPVNETYVTTVALVNTTASGGVIGSGDMVIVPTHDQPIYAEVSAAPNPNYDEWQVVYPCQESICGHLGVSRTTLSVPRTVLWTADVVAGEFVRDVDIRGNDLMATTQDASSSSWAFTCSLRRDDTYPSQGELLCGDSSWGVDDFGLPVEDWTLGNVDLVNGPSNSHFASVVADRHVTTLPDLCKGFAVNITGGTLPVEYGDLNCAPDWSFVSSDELSLGVVEMPESDPGLGVTFFGPDGSVVASEYLSRLAGDDNPVTAIVNGQYCVFVVYNGSSFYRACTDGPQPPPPVTDWMYLPLLQRGQ